MGDQPAGGTKGGVLKWSLWGVGFAGVAAVVYIIGVASIHPGGSGGLKALARGEMAKLETPAAPAPGPTQAFVDADGKPVRLADFRGKVVVLNLWATWCGPCVIEMPTLARLAQAYAGKPVVVVALSVDKAEGVDKAKAFIARNAPLGFYNDPKMAMPFALVPPSATMPTTVIFGPDGLERARMSGGADWAGPEARAVIDAVLAES